MISPTRKAANPPPNDLGNTCPALVVRWCRYPMGVYICFGSSGSPWLCVRITWAVSNQDHCGLQRSPGWLEWRLKATCRPAVIPRSVQWTAPMILVKVHGISQWSSLCLAARRAKKKPGLPAFQSRRPARSHCDVGTASQGEVSTKPKVKNGQLVMVWNPFWWLMV